MSNCERFSLTLHLRGISELIDSRRLFDSRLQLARNLFAEMDEVIAAQRCTNIMDRMMQSLISKSLLRMHAITALILTLATTGHASIAADPVYTKDPEHIPRLKERGSPTILLMPPVSPNPFRGLWIVDETCFPFKPGIAPQNEPGSALPPYKFLLWEVRDASKPSDDGQQLTLSGNTLTYKQSYVLNNLLVDDICTLTMDELGKSFVGEDREHK